MRSIKDDFKPISGSHVFYTPVLRGPEWKRQGLPRIGPVDRMVWHYLRAIDSVKRPTVAEIARQVWHPDGDYRSSARSSLKRLKAAGLAESDSKKRWFSIFPGSQGGLINPESGQINPDLEKSQGGSINPESGLIDPESGSINPPEEIGQSGLINPPKVGQSTHLSGSINPPKWADQPTIEKREERRKEMTTMRERAMPVVEDFLIEEQFDLLDAMSKHPGIFVKGLAPPTSLDGIDIYCQIAVKAQIEIKRLKGDPVLNRQSYGKPVFQQFLNHPIQAKAALEALLKLNRQLKSKNASTEKTAASVSRDKKIASLPTWDDHLDDPAIKPMEWLKSRIPSLHDRVSAIEVFDGSDSDYFHGRAKQISKDFLARWKKAGRKSKLSAEPMRRDLLIKVSRLCDEFEKAVQA